MIYTFGYAIFRLQSRTKKSLVEMDWYCTYVAREDASKVNSEADMLLSTVAAVLLAGLCKFCLCCSDRLCNILCTSSKGLPSGITSCSSIGTCLVVKIDRSPNPFVLPVSVAFKSSDHSPLSYLCTGASLGDTLGRHLHRRQHPTLPYSLCPPLLLPRLLLPFLAFEPYH